MKNIQVVDKLTMFQMAVTDMDKAKEFYVDKLGLKITQDYKQDDEHWWVSLELPGGGTSITLTTMPGHLKPGSMQLYVTSPDIQASRQQLTEKGESASQILDDLYGPGSGVKWFSIKDPEGNVWMVAQSKV